MNKSIVSRRLLRYGGIALVVALALYILWVALHGLGSAEITAGICLLLLIGAMIYLRQSDVQADRNIAGRIRAEYSSESQPQVFAIYQHLKTKELEYLFLKILDDAKGDLNEVRKLAGLAESAGWKAFLENHW